MGDRYTTDLPGRIVIELDESGEVRAARAEAVEEEEGSPAFGMLPTGLPEDDIYRRSSNAEIRVEFYAQTGQVIGGGFNAIGTQMRDPYPPPDGNEANKTMPYVANPGFFEGEGGLDASTLSREAWEGVEAQIRASAGAPLIRPGVPNFYQASVTVNGRQTSEYVEGNIGKVKKAPKRIARISAGVGFRRGLFPFSSSGGKLTREPSPDAPEVGLDLPIGGVLRVYFVPEVYILAINFSAVADGDARRTIIGGDSFGVVHIISGGCNGGERTLAPGATGVYRAIAPNALEPKTVLKAFTPNEAMTRGEAETLTALLAGGAGLGEGAVNLLSAFLTTPMPVAVTTDRIMRDTIPNCPDGNAYVLSAPLGVLLGSGHIRGGISRTFGGFITAEYTGKLYEGRLAGRFSYEYKGEVKDFYVWDERDTLLFPPGAVGKPKAHGYGAIGVRGMTPGFTYTGGEGSTAVIPYPSPFE